MCAPRARANFFANGFCSSGAPVVGRDATLCTIKTLIYMLRADDDDEDSVCCGAKLLLASERVRPVLCDFIIQVNIL